MNSSEIAAMSAMPGLDDGESACQATGGATAATESSNYEALACLSAPCAERP